MLPDYWQTVHRLVVICLDDLDIVMQLQLALQALRSALPQSHITLLTAYADDQLTALSPWINQTLMHSTDGWKALESNTSTFGEVGIASAKQNPNGFGDVITLIRVIRGQQFDAAIIFTDEGRSPHALAYICYLAGISIRLGQSQEFGGSILSHCVKPPSDNIHAQERHLFLLKSVGFELEELNRTSESESCQGSDTHSIHSIPSIQSP
ncbi:MAG: glycosyltransferase family 9 protein [Leptolyngbyaceae cyanobacterium RM2_2_4]|nr:glycosyltransferase family 9 protein [Leptolyngbyaceae cyanobacterium SL_5_14]NJO49833.1 glycosyltransferase family 9 protein [Leptolyngbyaceae cyanobacterium RM2_2_4]